jgi:hypothetical protein
MDDDWVWGKGARFGEDDVSESFVEYDYDDGFGVPMESPSDATTEEGVKEMPFEGGDGTRRLVDDEAYELDVVFVGDSITEQRQGTSMGREDKNDVGIKEVFDKTFTKEKVSLIRWFVKKHLNVNLVSNMLTSIHGYIYCV